MYELVAMIKSLSLSLSLSTLVYNMWTLVSFRCILDICVEVEQRTFYINSLRGWAHFGMPRGVKSWVLKTSFFRVYTVQICWHFQVWNLKMLYFLYHQKIDILIKPTLDTSFLHEGMQLEPKSPKSKGECPSRPLAHQILVGNKD